MKLSKTGSTLMAATTLAFLSNSPEASQVYPHVLPFPEELPYALPQAAPTQGDETFMAEEQPVLADIDSTGSIDPDDPTLWEGGPHFDGVTVGISEPNQRYCIAAESPDFAIHSAVWFCQEEGGCFWLDGAYVTTPGDGIGYCGTLEQPGEYIITVFPNFLLDEDAGKTFGRYSLKVSDTLDSSDGSVSATLEDPIALGLNEAKLSALANSDQAWQDRSGNVRYLKAFVVQGTGDTLTAEVRANDFSPYIFVFGRQSQQELGQGADSVIFDSPAEEALVVVTSLEPEAVGQFEIEVLGSAAGGGGGFQADPGDNNVSPELRFN